MADTTPPKTTQVWVWLVGIERAKSYLVNNDSRPISKNKNANDGFSTDARALALWNFREPIHFRCISGNKAVTLNPRNVCAVEVEKDND